MLDFTPDMLHCLISLADRISRGEHVNSSNSRGSCAYVVKVMRH